jgi:hypothetical protein
VFHARELVHAGTDAIFAACAGASSVDSQSSLLSSLAIQNV